MDNQTRCRYSYGEHAMSDRMERWYQCEKCGHMFKTVNWELSGRIVCWQTADGQCATAPNQTSP